MPVHNADIASVFNEIADLLQIEGENPFRIRAYRNAARTVQGLGRNVAELVAAGEDLTMLPGIGKDLAAKISEIIETGHCSALDKLRQKLPPELGELLQIAGLGPKKVSALYHEMGIKSIAQLHRAARDKRLQSLPGFGEKTETRIIKAIENRMEMKSSFLRAVVVEYAETLVRYLKESGGVDQVTVAGSYRRCKETVGDLDILVTAAPGSSVMERFTGYDEVKEVVAKGKTRATVILRSGLQVDVRVVDKACYGAALHYFTGSKAHNIMIRRLGRQRGLKINEYGVFRGDKKVAGDTEESVFQSLGLSYIPPELREDRGEIEAARDGVVPCLVEFSDLRGDLHIHTSETDGQNTLEEMALAARQRGFEYLAVTEHSRRLTVTRGLDEARLVQQIEAIDRLNDKLEGITLLKGIEVDILEDGSLDLPGNLLARLDLVVGAVHSKFNLPRDRQTARILRAMEHPFFSILAHPTGRLLPSRPPYEVDVAAVVRKARQRGCFLELNAQPERLDLADTFCRLAKEEGVLVSINSDSHNSRGFDNLCYGIDQARRGWLTKKDVLNTYPLAGLRKLLKATMGGKE